MRDRNIPMIIAVVIIGAVVTAGGIVLGGLSMLAAAGCRVDEANHGA